MSTRDPMIPAGMSRRHFLQHMALTSLSIPAFHFTQAVQANVAQLKKQGKSCILLWMSGGPATIDIWDLKPGADTGGEFRQTETSAPGVLISEHMPNVAKQMHNLAIIRSMSTVEADHNGCWFSPVVTLSDTIAG